MVAGLQEAVRLPGNEGHWACRNGPGEDLALRTRYAVILALYHTKHVQQLPTMLPGVLSTLQHQCRHYALSQ